MQTITARPTKDNRIQFCCPHCLETKTLPPSRGRERLHSLKVRCSCRNILQLSLEGREKFRKPTDLEGIFAGQRVEIDRYRLKRGQDTVGFLTHNCRIRDLSLKGVGIQTLRPHGFGVGQRLAVAFLLDNSGRTLVEREAVVCHARADYLGCSLLSNSPDVTLGLYLL